MTAVIGILNKNAVVMAADSAVTITSANNSSKVFNNANKLFALSKHRPVGIMIYSNAEFMGVPWETIIKMYREQLGEKSFPLLADYQKDFVDFVKNKKILLASQDDFYKLFVSQIILDCLRNVDKDLANIGMTKFVDDLVLMQQQYEHSPKCPDFEELSLPDFITNPKFDLDFIKQILLKLGLGNIDDDIFKQIQITVHTVLCAVVDFIPFLTGLVFTGFGEEEIFPSLIALNVFFAIDNRLRYHISTVEQITSNNRASICPFAQTDVIDTILQGADPQLKEKFEENFFTILDKYHQRIIQIIGINNQASELLNQLKELDLNEYKQLFVEANQSIQQKYYIHPLLNTIASLSKEDLVEMAESLIHLTYLKRRITNAQESVGGPVDVAVISKGDGFVWMKRKHYLDKNLNNPIF